MCFVWTSERERLYISIQYWLLFITATECVYWAVRTESLRIIQVNICLCGVKQWNMKFWRKLCSAKRANEWLIEWVSGYVSQSVSKSGSQPAYEVDRRFVILSSDHLVTNVLQSVIALQQVTSFTTGIDWRIIHFAISEFSLINLHFISKVNTYFIPYW